MNNELGKLPESLREVIRYFTDAENSHKWAVALRWPNGIECPRCASKEHSYISTRHLWFCKGCKKQFTVKVGSIFEDSPLSMDKWMTAVWLMVTCENGISSYEIASYLGISQKSAWHMMHCVRKALQDKFTGGKLSGEVEADETFIGGKARNMHKAKRAEKITGTGGKDVMGMMERGGKVRAMILDNRKKQTVQANVKEHVEAGADIRR
jgi:transposase-like protein